MTSKATRYGTGNKEGILGGIFWSHIRTGESVRKHRVKRTVRPSLASGR